MPRKRIGPEQPPPANELLAERLASELTSSRESGQPLVYERELGSQRLRVTVVWDEWDGLSLDERNRAILRAYELAEGPDSRDRLALVSGLTVPEATAIGMLPWQIGVALRRGDPVSRGECETAMAAEGASRLFGQGILQLRFATREEAEACRQRLIDRLPRSEDLWVISVDIAVQDHVTVMDSAAIQ